MLDALCALNLDGEGILNQRKEFPIYATMIEKKQKELLFSVTAKDCEWSYTRGTGAGGQKKNKTSSAVHCTHKQSGAHGYAEDSRSQADNKILAFQRMANTEKFKIWHRIETMKRSGEMATIDSYVEREIKKVKIECKDENGRWIDMK